MKRVSIAEQSQLTSLHRFTPEGSFLGYVGCCINVGERERVEADLQLQSLSHRLFTKITLKIRQSLQLDEILQITLREIQRLLSVDRMLIFRRDETALLQHLAHPIEVALIQSQLLEQETRQHKERARSSAELEQFAYSSSHDLQELLRMVISYPKSLEQCYQHQLDASADKLIDYAIEKAGRIQTLIRDLLIFLRVSTRGQPSTKVDSKQALQRAIIDLQFAIQKSEAIITHNPLPQVMANATQLTQLFQNLVENALKFCHQGIRHIHIGVLNNIDNNLTFYGRDSNIGIERQCHDRSFAIIQQLHSRHQYPGIRLGLSLCKKIVERHRKHIWFASELEQGTTFYFTLFRGNNLDEFTDSNFAS